MSFQEVVKVPQGIEDTVQPVHVLTVTFPFSCLVAGVVGGPGIARVPATPPLSASRGTFALPIGLVVL